MGNIPTFDSLGGNNSTFWHKKPKLALGAELWCQISHFCVEHCCWRGASACDTRTLVLRKFRCFRCLFLLHTRWILLIVESKTGGTCGTLLGRFCDAYAEIFVFNQRR